jgi:ribonuclease H / adenosylcobalamin/alpha-ribazole phosphatase
LTKGVRKAGKTTRDAERRRLAKRSRAAAEAAAADRPLPAGWSVLWCDGGSRGNPGPAAYAFVIESGGAELASASAPLGVATAATAEYRAVVAGLEAAARLALGRVEVRIDSRLVMEHLDGTRPAPRNPALRGLCQRAAELGRQIGTVRYRWVPSDRNGRADAMVSDVLAG